MIIDLPQYLASYKVRLACLSGRLGKQASARINQLAKGEFCSVSLEKEGDAATAQRPMLKMKLLGAPVGKEATKARLIRLQDETVDVLLRDFDTRLPVPRVAVLFRTVFDFRIMPLEETTEANMKLLGTAGGAAPGVAAYGEKEMRVLVAERYPELDAEDVVSQMMAVDVFVRNN